MPKFFPFLAALSNVHLLIIPASLAITAGIFCALAFAIGKRRGQIYAKYGRTQMAERIIKKTVWVGATYEQLHDSLGKPAITEDIVTKGKPMRVCKYFTKATKRYWLKVTFENGAVVGWAKK